MTNKLKPCPFCGEEPEATKKIQGYGPRISCKNNHCRMSALNSMNTGDWNGRAIPEGYTLVPNELIEQAASDNNNRSVNWRKSTIRRFQMFIAAKEQEKPAPDSLTKDDFRCQSMQDQALI